MQRRIHIIWQLTRLERASLLAVVLALLVVIPVLAAYLGPSRSYTYTEIELEKVRDPSKDEWTLTNDNPPAGFLDTCTSVSSCDTIPNVGWQLANCGWTADNASCELGYTWVETVVTHTGTYPEANVSRSIACGTNGANGWCLQSATLNITGSEPLAGQSIVGIEGTLDGTPFYCAGRNCAVPGASGEASAEFWALSTWGDSSRKGSATLKLDLDLPTLDGLIAGTPGNGGWYVSSVALTADASDATSGLDFAQVRVDGGGWVNNSTTLSTDGQYSVEFRAQDLAGQSVSIPAADVWVDVTPPALSLTPSGAAGLAGWYVSDVDVVLNASDTMSGLAGSQLQVDGGGWLALPGVTLAEGVYSIAAEALDVAGNFNATSLNVSVDTTAPALTITETGTAGDAGWYTSPSVTVDASASDATSGVAGIQMQTDGAGFAPTTSQTVSGEGDHSVDTVATDVAGNSRSDNRVIRIDSIAPTLALTSHNSGSAPEQSNTITISGSVADATSGPASVQFSADGGASWAASPATGGAWSLAWDSTSVRNGLITLQVRPLDAAGNIGTVTRFDVQVANARPYLLLPAGCVAIWEIYAIAAGPGSNPLAGLTLTVSDPQGRWPARDYTFGSVPESWSWDRQFGDGTVAPPGEYAVLVAARDTVGNTTTRAGCIAIPDPDVAASVAGVTEPIDPVDESDSPDSETPPEATSLLPELPSLQKSMVNPTGPAVTTKVPVPESGASTAEAARLALATASNAPAWGDAALALAAAATAFVLANKQKREDEEAERQAELALRAERRAEARKAALGILDEEDKRPRVAISPERQAELDLRAERRAMERQAGKVLAADLTDEQVMAQVIAAGGDPNMSIEQARAITHNARLGKGMYSPTGADLMAAQQKAAGEKKIGGGEYIVQPGDNWFSIAQAVYGNQRMAGKLMEANGITDVKTALDTNFLQPGQKIKLPGVRQSQAADPLFQNETWRAAEVFTARITGGDVGAVLTAHLEEDIQSWLDGKISTKALAGKLPDVDLDLLRRPDATPGDILADYSRALALLEAMFNSEHMVQILRDGDPDPDWIREVEGRMTAYGEMVRSGDITLGELQALVAATVSVNLQSNLHTAQLQTAGQDVAAVGKALEAVYAAHGAEPPWQGTTYTNYLAAQLVDQLTSIQLKQSLYGEEDPNVAKIQAIQTHNEQLKLGLVAGTLSAEAVTTLVQGQINELVSRDLDRAWSQTEGLSDTQRGAALEQIYDFYGMAAPWQAGGFESYMAEVHNRERSNQAASLRLKAEAQTYAPKEIVPAFWSDPVGWFSATLVNWGREKPDERTQILQSISNGVMFISDYGRAFGEAYRQAWQNPDPNAVMTFGPSALEGVFKEALVLTGQKNNTNNEIIQAWSDTSRTILAAVLLAANDGIAEFNQVRRYALGQEALPEGMTRGEAIGKLAFNTLNVMTLGSLGDIVYGIRDEQGLRVAAGLVGIIPAVRLIRYGGALVRGGIVGGRVALQAAKSSAIGVTEVIGASWDEGLRLMRIAQANDVARAIAIFNQVGIRNEKLINLAANTIISHVDEVGDGLLAASEFWEGWKNDDVAQMTVGAIFGLVAAGGVAKNPWQRLDLESPIGRQVMGNVEMLRRATPETIALFESRGINGLTAAFRHGDVGLDLVSRHQNTGLDFLIRFGDDGLAALRKFPELESDIIRISNQFGQDGLALVSMGPRAVQVFDNFETELLETVIRYLNFHGEEGIDALERFGSAALYLHSPNLLDVGELSPGLAAALKGMNLSQAELDGAAFAQTLFHFSDQEILRVLKFRPEDGYGRLSLEQSLILRGLAGSYGREITITGRWGMRPEMLAVRKDLWKDTVRLARQRGSKVVPKIPSQGKGFDEWGGEFRALSAEVIGTKNVALFQARIPTGKSEIDFFVGEKDSPLRAILRDVFHVAEADQYPVAFGIPPGGITFDSLGAVKVNSFGTPLREPLPINIDHIKRYISGLEALTDKPGHALERHGPEVDMSVLFQRAQKLIRTGDPATKFTSYSEMNDAIQSAISANWDKIATLEMRGVSGAVEFYGPEVDFVGVWGNSKITGKAPSKIVLYFDEHGKYSLLTAYPDAKVLYK